MEKSEIEIEEQTILSHYKELSKSLQMIVKEQRLVIQEKSKMIEKLNQKIQIKNEINTIPSLLDFRDIRKSKLLTLKQVEEITGISNAYLSQLETGKIKRPSFHVVKKLYDLYME